MSVLDIIQIGILLAGIVGGYFVLRFQVGQHSKSINDTNAKIDNVPQMIKQAVIDERDRQSHDCSSCKSNFELRLDAMKETLNKDVVQVKQDVSDMKAQVSEMYKAVIGIKAYLDNQVPQKTTRKS